MSRLGSAFGLALDVRFECDGLPSPVQTAPSAGRTVRLELTSDPHTTRLPEGSKRVWHQQPSDGESAAHLDADPVHGLLFSATDGGEFLIDPSATRVLCAPAPVAPWRWQRFLVGQVLPLLALLHESEIFHASAVTIRSSGVAFFGPSGSGKSSLAAAMVLRGGRYLTDDVVAIAPQDVDDPTSVRAYPGFGLVNLRRDMVQRLAPGAIEALGRQVGSDEHGVRLAVDVAERPARLACAYFVDRRAGVGGCKIVECAPVDPRLLLGSSYNFVMRDADRLTRQLDTCARLASSVRLFTLSIAADVTPFEVAASIDEHVATLTTAE